MDQRTDMVRTVLRAALILIVLIALLGSLKGSSMIPLTGKIIAGAAAMLLGAVFAFMEKERWFGLVLCAIGAIIVIW